MKAHVSQSLQIKGEAEAYAVEARGRAEAEQMAKKAEAFQEYKDGAMVDMLLEKLPLVRDVLLHRSLQSSRLSSLQCRNCHLCGGEILWSEILIL